jgi:flagellin
MSLNSVNTNMGAMVALQSLQATNSALAATQKQISTGYRVADSTDDGAAYAIAQGIRSTVGGLTSANQQLGNVSGLLTTTQTALNGVSTLQISMRAVLVKLADSSVVGNDRANYQAQFTSLLANVKTDINSATYNGKSLIGNISPTTSGYAASVSVAQDGIGNSYTIGAAGTAAGALGASAAYTSMASLIPAGTAPLTATTAQAALTAHGNFSNQQSAINTKLNSIGSNINYVSNQTTYNNNKIDALNSGLGSLIDADLAKESAQLTALQIRQQLGTQSLSMANQAPQSLMSLFK